MLKSIPKCQTRSLRWKGLQMANMCWHPCPRERPTELKAWLPWSVSELLMQIPVLQLQTTIHGHWILLPCTTLQFAVHMMYTGNTILIVRALLFVNKLEVYQIHLIQSLHYPAETTHPRVCLFCERLTTHVKECGCLRRELHPALMWTHEWNLPLWTGEKELQGPALAAFAVSNFLEHKRPISTIKQLSCSGDPVYLHITCLHKSANQVQELKVRFPHPAQHVVYFCHVLCLIDALETAQTQPAAVGNWKRTSMDFAQGQYKNNDVSLYFSAW